MQGGLLGVGIENKRNISVISMNGGNMNFEMQAPYESDEESTDVLDTELASSHERYASRKIQCESGFIKSHLSEINLPISLAWEKEV